MGEFNNFSIIIDVSPSNIQSVKRQLLSLVNQMEVGDLVCVYPTIELIQPSKAIPAIASYAQPKKFIAWKALVSTLNFMTWVQNSSVYYIYDQMNDSKLKSLKQVRRSYDKIFNNDCKLYFCNIIDKNQSIEEFCQDHPEQFFSLNISIDELANELRKIKRI